MTDTEKHFYDTMIQRIKDMEEERAKKEIHPNIIVMGEDHFHSLERQAVTKCDHPHQWGSLSVGGVKVFSSPHLPPDTMLVIDDSAMKDVWPALSMQLPNDPWHYMVTAPRPMPDFDPLLRAAHGGMFACAPRLRVNVFDLDEPPAKETRALACVHAARVKFYSDRITLHAKLRDIANKHFFAELARRGKTWPQQERLPQPPFKSASQTRAAAQKAKAKARRKALRSRKRSKRALQRA